MQAADNFKRQVAATSQYRQRPVLEWSKQLSRSTSPFFLSTAPPNIRQNYGADVPRRHERRILFDKTISRDEHADNECDRRDYSPIRYEELHHHCTVNIGKNLPRTDIFTKSGGAETSIDPFQHPGWVRGKSSLARAPRETFKTPVSWSSSATADLDASFEATSTSKTAPAFRFGKSSRDATEQTDARSVLNVTEKAVTRNLGVLSIARASSRLKNPKPSDGYRELLLNDACPPLAPAKARITHGFAPMRYNHRLTLADTLAQSLADAKRARSVMDSYFGERSRSQTRSAILYTPVDDHQ